MSLVQLIAYIKNIQDLKENYGDKVINRAGTKAHLGNILGVFWYNFLDGILDYVKGDFNHNQFQKREEYVKTNGMIRGRLVKDDDGKIFIFIYTDDFGNYKIPGNAINDLYNKISEISKETISYIVDELGRDLIEENVKNAR
jgi:hypothetical protein